MDSNKQMADLLFKNITKTPDDYEQMYPKRNLEEGAVVTRFAPSPTGFLHFGGLFAAFIGKTATKSTNGVFDMIPQRKNMSNLRQYHPVRVLIPIKNVRLKTV